MPFKHFIDMYAFHHAKQLGRTQLYRSLFK